MRWLIELGVRAGPALLVPPLGAVASALLFAMRFATRARLRGRLRAALAALGPPTPDPFASPDRAVCLDGSYARDAAADGRAWLVVDGQRVALAGARRLLVGDIEPWRADGRRSLAQHARVRARGVLQRVEADPDAAPPSDETPAWSLGPDGDTITLAALDPSHLRDAPYTAWSLGVVAVLLALLGAVTAGGGWAAAQLDASPQPVAMTARGLRWETRWKPPQRARLALASVSPLHHRAAQRLLRAGRPREVGIPWLDPREMERTRALVHALGDCGLEAELLRRTGQDPPSDDRCGLRARIDDHPLARAIRDEAARAAAVPVDRLACMERHASALRARLADPALPFLLRDAAACVRDAAAMCGPIGCPAVVTVDLGRLVIEHRVALRATTHGPTLRPAWWRRPSLLRHTLRRLASVGAALAVDALDERFARGAEWPQGYTWASVAETMRGFPTAPRGYRPIVAHLPGVGVVPIELANPWTSLELRAASSSSRLAAQVEWWRLGEYAPSRDAPARERSALVQRAVAAAGGRHLGAVITVLGDPTVESVEALALVAYRITSERDVADGWLRAAPVFQPPDPADHAARCRLRTALRQAAQRLRRTELLAAMPWAAESSRACAFGDEAPAEPSVGGASPVDPP